MAVFYMDPFTGNDNFTGDAPDKAWRTLMKASAYTFMPGDRLLFRAGGIWQGHLHLKGSGTADAPITVGSYGEGPKPVIDGAGAAGLDANNGVTVLLYNQDYWEISGLEITNDAEEEGERWGIMVRWHDYGTGRHVYIRNCDIHDIRGCLRPRFRGDGIIVVASGSHIRTCYDDVLIEDNTFRNIDRTAIVIWSQWAERGRVNFKMGTGYSLHSTVGPYTPNTNVVVRGNVIDSCAGDGILVQCTKDCLVEYNVASNCNCKNGYRFHDANVPIWPQNSDGFVMQYNEAYDTKSTSDGQGYDIDFECYDTTVQYNYSHDNEGGFMLIMDEVYDTVIRYNISQNDGCAIFDARNEGYAAIYNNTFYMGSEKIFRDGRAKKNGLFANNIFYCKTPAEITEWGGYEFRSNCYYNLTPKAEESDAVVADPGFTAGGTGAVGRDTLKGYTLKADSPCKEKGIVIPDNGGIDFFGDPIGEKPSIGAVQ